jgi:hypothetical protein
LRQVIYCLALAMALVSGTRVPGARAAGDDTSANVGVPVWAFTVLNYTAVGSGRAVEKLSFPTPEACEAARQGVLEIGEEMRPIPVVGRCRNEDGQRVLPSS